MTNGKEKKTGKRYIWTTKKSYESVYGKGNFIQVDLSDGTKEGEEVLRCISIAKGKYSEYGDPSYSKRITFQANANSLEDSLVVDDIIEMLKKVKKDYSSMK